MDHHGRDLPRRQGRREGDRERHRRHRHHQSARDHCVMAPRHRASGASRHRLAGSAHRQPLRPLQGRGSRAAREGQDRTFARSLFFRHQARLAPGSLAGHPQPGGAGRTRVRHGRHVSLVAADRRQSPRHRRDECVAHAALQHPRRPLGRRAVETLWRTPGCSANGARLVGGVWSDPPRRPGHSDSDLRHRRRPAGGADRPSLFRTRHAEGDSTAPADLRSSIPAARRSPRTTSF